MQGWHISVYRLSPPAMAPAKDDAKRGARIAVWQADAGGRSWLDRLVGKGTAVLLGGDGYPTCYTAPASAVLPPVLAGPPDAKKVWSMGESDVAGAGWSGETAIDRSAAKRCRKDEWLLIEVWDES